jgi:hypothetical protein
MAANPSSPYIIAAVITAIPATLAASSAWYQAHRGRKENTGDHAKVVEHLQALDTKIQKVDIRIERMDLRFDSIEDKVERHLGWHRNEAGSDESLKEALSKEYKGDYPTQRNTISPDAEG